METRDAKSEPKSIPGLPTFDLLDVCHVVVDRRRRDDIRHIGADVHLDDLSDRRRWRWMIRRWKPVSTVESVYVFLASVAFRREERRRLCLHIEIRRTVEVPVKIGTAAQATEEAYSRVRLQT